MKYILVLTATLAALQSYGAQADTSSLVNKPMPAYSLSTIDGKTISNKSLKGKVVLLDFWATWCGPCKAASPSMQALHKKYASKGLVVVGANCLEQVSKPTKEPAAKYAKEHGYTYTFAYNSDALTKKCLVQGIPTMIIIDKKGVIRKVQVGWSDGVEKTLDVAIAKLLK